MEAVSTAPATIINKTARVININESQKTYFIHLVFGLETSAEIIPPAIPPKKYPSISSEPCGRKTKIARGIPNAPPKDLDVIPIAAAKIEAFQLKINIAPELYKNESTIEIVNTIKLFETIFEYVPKAEK